MQKKKKNPKEGDWLKVLTAAGIEEASQMSKERHSTRASLPRFGSFSWH